MNSNVLKVSAEAKSFISQLLNRKVEAGLGVNGVDEIKNHPWVAGTKWKSHERIFVPKVRNADTRYHATGIVVMVEKILSVTGRRSLWVTLLQIKIHTKRL